MNKQEKQAAKAAKKAEKAKAKIERQRKEALKMKGIITIPVRTGLLGTPLDD